MNIICIPEKEDWIEKSGTFTLKVNRGYDYKIFLIDGATIEPLCPVWDSRI